MHASMRALKQRDDTCYLPASSGRGERAPLSLVPSGPDPKHAFSELDVELDTEAGAYWCFLQPQGRPCFSAALLADLAHMGGAVRYLAARRDDGDSPFRFFVMASRISGVFNLGGDLALFADAIERGERAKLQHYAYACIDAVHANNQAYDAPLVTVALVQGDALGGGFECALSFDFIIAERRARMGLPEVLFNLFPGMGAYSFLSRRLDPVRAQKMILSGRIYTAEELHEIGIVDVLAEDGEGHDAVRRFMAKTARSHNSCHAVMNARRCVHPVTRRELLDVVDIWVDAAMRLREADLRKMRRLVAAQNRRQ